MPATRGYDAVTRLIHLLLAVFAIAALISGQFAGDYRGAWHPGFDAHRWIGGSMALALALRLVWGFAGPRAVRFAHWLPATRRRLAAVRQDIASLARLQLPVREDHQGLAALLQAIGLLAFLWMAASGVLLFVYLEPGARASGWLAAVKELHEGGQAIAIAYVVLHAGAVLAHSLAGHPVWRRMLLWGAP